LALIATTILLLDNSWTYEILGLSGALLNSGSKKHISRVMPEVTQKYTPLARHFVNSSSYIWKKNKSYKSKLTNYREQKSLVNGSDDQPSDKYNKQCSSKFSLVNVGRTNLRIKTPYSTWTIQMWNNEQQYDGYALKLSHQTTLRFYDIRKWQYFLVLKQLR
jgi:hypothetical protein